ncbi:MAG: alpha/beta hydrolase [Roseovarius sp.]|jgi:arylformamidase
MANMTLKETRFSQDEMEMQYNLRLLRPDYNSAVVPDWEKRSERTRATRRCTLDLAYGDGPDDRMDVFPSDDPRGPILVYFHGGYWQRGDRKFYSFLGDAFVDCGITVVLAGYTLCPATSITGIVGQARAAVAKTILDTDRVPGNRDRLVVGGHSAGGQITGMIMATDFSTVDPALPVAPVGRGMPMSALFDLGPLRDTTINDSLSIDDAEVASMSPMQQPPVGNAPQLVIVGGGETEEFHRQSDNYAALYQSPDRPVDRYNSGDDDHFDLLNSLADPASPLFARCRDFILG